MHQQASTLDVAKELRAQAGAFVGAFDQAGDVGDDEADFICLFADDHHAEIRLQGGEGIVGDFRARGGNTGNQRGLADVGKADQADIGQELEFETEDAFFAGASIFVLARGLMRGGGEAGVAAATASAMGDDDALIGAGKVPDFLAGFFVVDDGADRDLENDVDAFASGAVGAFAVASALGFVFRVKAEVDERVVTLAGFHDDVATLAAVAAGGAAARDKFLAAKGQTAVAAVAGFDSDCGFVDEHREAGLGVSLRSWDNRLGRVVRSRVSGVRKSGGG